MTSEVKQYLHGGVEEGDGDEAAVGAQVDGERVLLQLERPPVHGAQPLGSVRVAALAPEQLEVPELDGLAKEGAGSSVEVA